jgi:Flp pilus assembly protein TadD
MDAALAALERGDRDTALRLCAEATERDPRDPIPPFVEGNIRSRAGEWARAEECLRLSLKRNPKFPPALQTLSVVLLEQGRDVEAERVLRELATLRPELAGPHVNLGVLLRKRGDLPGAEKAFRHAVELEPGNRNALLNLGTIAADQGRLVEAAQHLRRARAAAPGNPEAAFRLAEVLLAISSPPSADFSEARELLERLWKAAPGNPQVGLLLAHARARAGEADAARKLLDEVLKAHPDQRADVEALARKLEIPSGR